MVSSISPLFVNPLGIVADVWPTVPLLRTEIAEPTPVASEPFSVDANPAIPDIMPGLQYPGEAANFDFSTILPRAGITYAVGEDKDILLRASFSQFAEQLDTHNNREVAQMFGKLAKIEALHAKRILEEMGWPSMPAPPPAYAWDTPEGPETAPMESGFGN